jgi:hypothetical protein
MGRQQQPIGPITGISSNDDGSESDNETTDGEGFGFRNNPLTNRIKELRERKFVNPITFVRENGGGLETFGIWLYEYRYLFILLTVLILIVGMLFDRRVSFAAGIGMMLVGSWLGRIDDENDPFTIYICGFIAAVLPFALPA